MAHTIFLKIPKVRGDVVISPYEGWHELMAYSETSVQNAGGISRKPPAGYAMAFDMEMRSKIADAAAVQFAQFVNSGSHIQEVTLVILKGTVEVFRMVLKDVLFSTYSVSSHAGADILAMHFELNASQRDIRFGSNLITRFLQLPAPAARIARMDQAR